MRTLRKDRLAMIMLLVLTVLGIWLFNDGYKIFYRWNVYGYCSHQTGICVRDIVSPEEEMDFRSGGIFINEYFRFQGGDLVLDTVSPSGVEKTIRLSNVSHSKIGALNNRCWIKQWGAFDGLPQRNYFHITCSNYDYGFVALTDTSKQSALETAIENATAIVRSEQERVQRFKWFVALLPMFVSLFVIIVVWLLRKVFFWLYPTQKS